MTIELKVNIEEAETSIQLPDNEGSLTIYAKEKVPELKAANFYMFFSKRQLTGYSYKGFIGEELREDMYDEVILIELPWEIEGIYFYQLLSETSAPLKPVTNQIEGSKIPQAMRANLDSYYQKIQVVLTMFGFNIDAALLSETLAKPGKARHRWRKEIGEIDFFIDGRQSKATVRWQKRNEMLIKAGAIMKPDTPLNKDGSVGFAAKMAEKIRSDHQTSFKEFKTTEDIILKSVNEVGLFLYFGGTNSWLEMRDKDGQTINEWTVVS